MRRVGAALERGLPGLVPRALAALWAARATPVRALALPRGVRVVGVAGATLGGSGATPLAIALARAARARGLPVALVSHGHRARGRDVRDVRPRDSVRECGDEAVLAADELVPRGVTVLTGPRAGCLARAAAVARGGLVVLDGVLQFEPQRLQCAVLVLDAVRPWGAGACPPAGDLRASVPRLLSAADVVCTVGAQPASARPERAASPGAGPLCVRRRLLGAVGAPGVLGVERLRSLRLGLVLAVARPERVVAALAQQGIVPRRVRIALDHHQPRAPWRPERELDAWLTTAKCGTRLGSAFGGKPLLRLVERLELPEALLDSALGLDGGPPIEC